MRKYEMTLICCARIKNGTKDAVLLSVDSMFTGGHRWPTGPKLFPILGRSDCAIAFEGDMQLAYALLVNALNIINFSDNLKNSDTGADSVASRITNDIEIAYQGLIADKDYDPRDWNCSFVFVGWSNRLMEPIVRHIHLDKDGSWFCRDVNDKKEGEASWRDDGVWFLGSGEKDPVGAANRAWREGISDDSLRAYRAFCVVLNNPSETSVGGMPQIAMVDSNGCEVIGINKENRRYLLGLEVSAGITGVRYLPMNLDGLLDTTQSKS